MFRLETSTAENRHGFSIEESARLLLRIAEDETIEFRRIVTKNLTLHLTSWSPSPEAINRYPFLKDTRKLLKDYTACLEVVIYNTENVVGLHCNKEKLQAMGLPSNLVYLLEYGDDLIKPIPAIRLALVEIKGLILKRMAKVFKKQ